MIDRLRRMAGISKERPLTLPTSVPMERGHERWIKQSDEQYGGTKMLLLLTVITGGAALAHAGFGDRQVAVELGWVAVYLGGSSLGMGLLEATPS